MKTFAALNILVRQYIYVVCYIFWAVTYDLKAEKKNSKPFPVFVSSLSKMGSENPLWLKNREEDKV